MAVVLAEKKEEAYLKVMEAFVIETLVEAIDEMDDPLETEETMVEMVDADGVEGDVEVAVVR